MGLKKWGYKFGWGGKRGVSWGSWGRVMKQSKHSVQNPERINKGEKGNNLALTFFLSVIMAHRL